jgi:4-hydroxybenzoate polyprenyltransferase
MGIHAFSTIMDYDVDEKVGIKTFATVFGKRSAALFAFLAFVLTAFFARLSTLINPSPLNPFSSPFWFYIYCFLIFGSLLFFITLVFPSEKVAKLCVRLLVIRVLAGIILGVFMVATGFFFAPV